MRSKSVHGGRHITLFSTKPMLAFTLMMGPTNETSVQPFVMILAVVPLLCWLLVRWEKALIWVAAPLAAFCAIDGLYCVQDALVGTGYLWRHRVYPDWWYLGFAFGSAVFPAAAIRIAWLSPRADRQVKTETKPL